MSAMLSAETEVRPASTVAPTTSRITSIDAFRGFVMFLMLAEAMRLWTLHDAFPDSRFWAIVAFNTDARAVAGLLAPRSDSAGVLVPGRRGAAVLDRQPTRHAAQRFGPHARARRAGAASALILLGIFLRSLEPPADLLDVRGHADADRPRLHLPVPAGVRARCACRSARSSRSWSASGRRSSLYPLPRPGFDYTQVGVPRGLAAPLTGFLAHFNKNSNLAWAFDVWFLNLFPREKPFLFNGGGWSTLSFIPTLATMMLGTVVRRVAEDARGRARKAEGARRRRRRRWRSPG